MAETCRQREERGSVYKGGIPIINAHTITADKKT